MEIAGDQSVRGWVILRLDYFILGKSMVNFPSDKTSELDQLVELLKPPRIEIN